MRCLDRVVGWAGWEMSNNSDLKFKDGNDQGN